MSTVPIPKILANFETSLAATMSASATDLTLNRSTDNDGTTLSGLYSLTFDEGTTSEEHMTVTLTGASGVVSKRGLSRVDGFTEITANKIRHERGASVKITSFALLNIQRLLNGTDTFNTVDWAGINSITGLATPTSGETTKAANVAYVNAVSVAGASDASEVGKGIVEMGTAAQATAGTATGETGAPLTLTPARIATQIQSGSWLSGSTAGTADAITATLTPTLTALTHNMTVVLHNTTANNAGCTLNVDGLGAKAVYKYAGGTAIAVEANDMKANYHHIFLYDSDATVWLLINPVNGDLTAANRVLLETNLPALTGGYNSDATATHIHDYSGSPFALSFQRTESTDFITVPNINSTFGWSDSDDSLVFFYTNTGTSDETIYRKIIDAGMVGVQPYCSIQNTMSGATVNMTVAASNGAVMVGTDRFHSNGTSIFKNGSAVTISGTARYGKLAHDPTNNYLLVLYSTTKIARFSGISGTTITNISSDITLDTAVSQLSNFIYDAVNDQYIAIDSVNGVIRRFNSSGTTVDTVPFVDLISVATTLILGLCIYQNRVFLVRGDVYGYMSATGSGTNNGSITRIDFYPTAMTR